MITIGGNIKMIENVLVGMFWSACILFSVSLGLAGTLGLMYLEDYLKGNMSVHQPCIR